MELARQLAPELVGLPIDEVRQTVAKYPGLSLREIAKGDAYTQPLRLGRITVHVDNARVIGAHAG